MVIFTLIISWTTSLPFFVCITIPSMFKQIQKDRVQQVLYKALEEISLEKQYQEKCLSMLILALQLYKDSFPDKRQDIDAEGLHLLSKYQLMVSSVLMATLPRHFPGMPTVQACHFLQSVKKMHVNCSGLSLFPINKEERLCSCCGYLPVVGGSCSGTDLLYQGLLRILIQSELVVLVSCCRYRLCGCRFMLRQGPAWLGLVRAFIWSCLCCSRPCSALKFCSASTHLT